MWRSRKYSGDFYTLAVLRGIEPRSPDRQSGVMAATLQDYIKLPSVTSSFILTDHFIEAVTEYTHSPLTTIWGYRIGGRRCFAFRHTILPTFSTFLYRNKVYAVSQRIFESDFLLACIWNQYYYWILILIIASALDSVWIPRNLV